MTETRKFVKDSVVYTTGDILTKSLAFILIPIYTRYLSKSDYAIYNLVITIWPILIIVFGKGLAGYLIRGYFNLTSERDKKEFLGTILIFSIILSLIFSFLIHIAGESIFSLFFKNVSYKPFLQFAVGIAFFKLFINNVLSIYRAQRKPVRVVLLSFINFSINILLIIIFVIILRKELWGVLWGQLLSLFVISIIFFGVIHKDILYRMNKDYIRAGIFFALPLIPHALSAWIVNLSDRILIERFCTLEDLAIYSLGYQLAMALDIIINSMNQAWMPFFYENASNKNQEKELRKSTIFYFTIVVTLGLILGVFSPELINIAGKADYNEAINIFPLIILAFVIHSIYYMASTAMFYKQKTSFIPIISLTAGIVNVTLNILWLPKLGYVAAAYSTIISFLIMAILAYLFSLKYYRIPFEFSKMLLILLSACLLYFFSKIFPDLTLLLRIVFKIFLIALFPVFLYFLRIIKLNDLTTFGKIFISFKQN